MVKWLSLLSYVIKWLPVLILCGKMTFLYWVYLIKWLPLLSLYCILQAMVAGRLLRSARKPFSSWAYRNGLYSLQGSTLLEIAENFLAEQFAFVSPSPDADPELCNTDPTISVSAVLEAKVYDAIDSVMSVMGSIILSPCLLWLKHCLCG